MNRKKIEEEDSENIDEEEQDAVIEEEDEDLFAEPKFLCRVCGHNTNVADGDDLIQICDKCAETFNIDKIWDDLEKKRIPEDRLRSFDLTPYRLRKSGSIQHIDDLKCPVCGQYVPKESVSNCDGCHQAYCQECLRECCHCHKSFCANCLTLNDKSHTYLCNECAQKYEQKFNITCVFCKQTTNSSTWQKNANIVKCPLCHRRTTIMFLRKADAIANRNAPILPDIKLLTEFIMFDSNQENQIRNPPPMSYFTKIQELDLSYSDIISIPSELGQLSALQTLDISCTQITTIPPEIGRLSSLQTLDLSETKITTLPPEIGQLIALQTLDLSETKITTLPLEIGRLCALQTLNLSNTPITTLPPSIDQLKNLQQIDLSDTAITILPDSIASFPHLESLMLPDDLIYPRDDICEEGIEAIQAYLRDMQGILPLLLEKITYDYLRLSDDEREYPYLLKWGPQLEAACLAHPDSAVAQEIMILLTDKGFVSLSRSHDRKIWL